HGGRAHLAGGVDGVEGRGQIGGLAAGEETELELVRGDDVGDRDHAVTQQRRDGVADVAAGLRVTHDRVAGVDGLRVGGLDAGDGVDEDVGDVRAALVTGEHCVHLGQGTALLDAGDDLGDDGGRDHRATPGAV